MFAPRLLGWLVGGDGVERNFQIWDCATGEILTRISRTVEHLISATAVSGWEFDLYGV